MLEGQAIGAGLVGDELLFLLAEAAVQVVEVVGSLEELVA